MTTRIYLSIAIAAVVAFVIAFFGLHIYALAWILLASIALLSQAEHGGPKAKIILTATLGIVGLFIFVSAYGVDAASTDGGILESLGNLAHSIHLDIFVFLTGLYMVVNTFTYSGLIQETAWNVVKRARGKLGPIMVVIMVLTCILSGIFDGATIASVMGIITLTIMLSSGMKLNDIVKILLLLVCATNLGGVWFVLGEPTNILAASKLGLSPIFFLQYASIFALPAMVLTAFVAWRIVRKLPPIQTDRPELEILLEGISLKRTHRASGTLLETLRELGKIELRHLGAMQDIMEKEGLPDFEAALKAGAPQEIVYEALAINLESEELAKGLIDYYNYREAKDPMASILIGDLLHHVQEEYKKRRKSRGLVIFSGVVLVGLLILHAIVPEFPTWLGTLIAGVLAIASVSNNARKVLLSQTWHNVIEAFFLIAIFAIIAQLNFVGAFDEVGRVLLGLGSPAAVGAGILTGSSILSGFADNIAVMDILTNLIVNHPQWSFFALACIVGTALGGMLSPLASVQAVILATIIGRVAKVTFGRWMGMILKWFAVLLVVCVGLLLLFWALGLPPDMPLPTLGGGGH